MNHKHLLETLSACDEAREWYDDRPSHLAWRQCERGDWLLWIADRLGVDRKLVVLAACDCAETALKFVPAGEDRPRIAIETARKWASGEATAIKEVRADAADAYAAYAYAAYADAAYAAYAAAAYAAAAYAADAAAAYAAAAYASDATHAAAYAAARQPSLKESARLVRKRIPWRVVKAAIEAVNPS